MRKTITTLIAGLVLVSTCAETKAASRIPANIKRSLAETEAEIIRPRTTNFYEFLKGATDWTHLRTETNSYSRTGLLTGTLATFPVSEGKIKTEIHYDEEGREKERIESQDLYGNGFENKTRKTFAYDPVLKDHLIENNTYSWDATASAWVLSEGSQSEKIERDAAGNITVYTQSLYHNGEWIPSTRYTYVYGGTPAALTSIEESTYDSDTKQWSEKQPLVRNMEWAKFEGQVLEVEDNPVIGNNILKASERIDDKNGLLHSEYTVDGLNYEGTTTVKETGAVYEKCAYRVKDGNICFDTFAYSGGEPASMVRREIKYDEKGNLVLYMESIGTNAENLKEFFSERYDINYDANNGMMTEKTSFSKMEGETDYSPMDREVYSDFINAASEVESIMAENLSVSYRDGIVKVNSDGRAVLDVISISGAVVFRAELDGTASVNIEALPGGVYMLAVRNASGAGKTIKVLK